jgi:hypothetical protein
MANHFLKRSISNWIAAPVMINKCQHNPTNTSKNAYETPTTNQLREQRLLAVRSMLGRSVFTGVHTLPAARSLRPAVNFPAARSLRPALVSWVRPCERAEVSRLPRIQFRDNELSA